ncbi:hypothetical protein [Mollivirus kamchatka]|nr:hypothetical protein [Mollivirus kamchatka]
MSNTEMGLIVATDITDITADHGHYNVRYGIEEDVFDCQDDDEAFFALPVRPEREPVPRAGLWLLVLGGVGLLTVCAFLVVALPWYLGSIKPDHDLIRQMEPVGCTVLQHLPYDSDGVCIPYLVVSLHDSKGPRAPLIATPHIKHDENRMEPSACTLYLGAHRVGSNMTCYYNRMDPFGLVVVEDGIEGLLADLLVCIASATAWSATVVIATLWLGHKLSWFRPMHLQQTETL